MLGAGTEFRIWIPVRQVMMQGVGRPMTLQSRLENKVG
jgi:hypothetical protein